jgi:LCP family protein required for cell wall assembly
MVSTARSGVRAWLRTYVIALSVAATVTVGGLAGVNFIYDQKVKNIERVDVAVDENTDPAEPANFLLIGSDSRGFVSTPEEEEAFGDEADAGGQRSDTIMVLHVDPAHRKGLLVSFPRDLLVEIPGVGESKINAAYNDGPQKVIETVQTFFEIPIHHYLEVDFAGFGSIVDAVGGVTIYFDAAGRDEKTGFDNLTFGWKPGCYELNGGQALAYVRSRNYEKNIDGEWQADPTGDIGRIQRQQQFMRRLAADAVLTALNNPLKANRIADEGLSELKADEGLSRSDINKLIQAFRKVDPNDPNSIEMVTFPFDDTGELFEGQSVLYPNMEAAEPLLNRLRELVTPTEESAPPDGPAPSTIRVRVFNGSGVTGAAAETADALQAHGFQGGGTGNNPDGNIDETEVRYRPGSESKAEVVQALLTGGAKLIADDSIVEADVLLVLGEDFTGVSAPAGAVPTETAAPETAAPETAAPESTPDEEGGKKGEAPPTPAC